MARSATDRTTILKRWAAARSPGIIRRVADADVSDSELSDLERACRQLRREIIESVTGGADERLTAQRRILVDELLSAWVLASSLDTYIAELDGAVIDRRRRAATPIVSDRIKVGAHVVRLLQVIGLDPARQTDYFTRLCTAVNEQETRDAEPSEEKPAEPVEPAKSTVPENGAQGSGEGAP